MSPSDPNTTRILLKRRRRKRKRNLMHILRKKRKIVTLRTSTIRVRKERITPGEGLAILIGTQIGAGVLGLPYAAAQVGLVMASVVLLAVMFLLLFTGLIILKFSVDMNGAQMSTIANSILGRAGGWVMYISIFIMSFGALLAYVAGMSNVISSLFNINDTIGGLIFWLFASFVIYKGLEASGKTELIMSYIMLILFIGVVIILIPHANLKNGIYTNLGGLFTITGVAIFSLGCHTVIPDVYRGLGSYEKTRKVVILAFLIPTLIYGVFMAVFLLVFGKSTPQIATQGLSQIYGYAGGLLGNIIPLLAITTSYIGIGLANQSNTKEFLKIKTPLAWAITTIPPLLIYLAGIRNFADVLAFAGDTGDMMSFIILPLLILLAAYIKKRRI